MIIYNKKTKILEFFEPYGVKELLKFQILENKTEQDFLIILKNIQKDLVSKGLIIKNINYFKNAGPQYFNELELYCKGDPFGFCQVWSHWFVDYRVKHNKKNPNDLIDQFLKYMKKNNKSFKTFVRNYGEQLVLFYNNYAPSCGLDHVFLNDKCKCALQKLHSIIYKY